MAFPLIAALMLGGTAVQAYGQIEAGKAQEQAIKAQAEQERLAAESRELERQQKLNAALAANTVAMGLSGKKAEGTDASIALESSKQVGLSESVMGLGERLAFAQKQREASAAVTGSQYAAASTLLSGATKAYQAA
tara:strand:- start:97 stop:504 length:408 start_codon:yes stop_codon:yes gene_type:complete